MIRMLNMQSVHSYLIVLLLTALISTQLNAHPQSDSTSVGGTGTGTTIETSAAQVEAYFSQSTHRIVFSDDFTPDGNTAIGITNNVALFVDFQDPRMPIGVSVLSNSNSIILHPDSFIGGAVLSSDPSAGDPITIGAEQVSQVIATPADYRELCAFDHRVGGPVVAGTILATLSNGDTVTLGAEVGTSMINFQEISDATVAGGPVISWPNKFCRGVKKDSGSCLPRTCGMTLGDMIDLAGQFGLEIPANILAAGVDAVAEWLIGQGYVVSGECGEVQLIFPPIPLGCQCIYVQF